MYPIHQRINFLDLDVPLSRADVVIVPIPYDATLSFRPGARYGPGAILSASDELEFFDEELLTRLNDRISIHTEHPMFSNVDSPKEMIDQIEQKVSGLLQRNKFVVSLGGEHTISVGAVRAYSKKFQNISVLQIDAHPDMRDSYEGSAYSHACTLRRIHESVDTVVHVGNRMLSEEEYVYMKKNRILGMVHGVDFDIKKVVNQLTDDVYITIDMDGFDPSEVPGVGTPVPGGLKWRQVLRLLRELAKKKRIVGFDVTELSPLVGQQSSEMLAARLTYKLIGYSLLLKK